MADTTVNLDEPLNQIYGARMTFPFSAVGGLIGSGLDFLSASNAQGQQNNQFNEQMKFANQQLDWQKQLAMMGVRLRVFDAQEAGISPLVALGAPTFNPSPISITPTASSSGSNYAASLGKAGQDISAAIGRTMTEPEKLQMAYTQQKMINEQKLTDANVTALNAQANANNARALGTPSMPSVGPDRSVIAGQGGTAGLVGPSSSKVPEVLTAQPGSPGTVSGRAAPADQGYVTKNGLLEFQPSPGSPAAQGDIFNSAASFIRNRLVPNSWRTDADKGAIMNAIKSAFPGAVAYESQGLGYYRPVYPSEAVRIKSSPRQMTIFGPVR